MSEHGSAPPPPQSRPTKGALRARFEAEQDKVLDEAMDAGDTWAKNVRNGNRGVMLDQIPRLIEVLGLKLVDKSRICITPDELATFEAYKVIATSHLRPPAQRLDQDWETRP